MVGTHTVEGENRGPRVHSPHLLGRRELFYCTCEETEAAQSSQPGTLPELQVLRRNLASLSFSFVPLPDFVSALERNPRSKMISLIEFPCPERGPVDPLSLCPHGLSTPRFSGAKARLRSTRHLPALQLNLPQALRAEGNFSNHLSNSTLRV